MQSGLRLRWAYSDREIPATLQARVTPKSRSPGGLAVLSPPFGHVKCPHFPSGMGADALEIGNRCWFRVGVPASGSGEFAQLEECLWPVPVARCVPSSMAAAAEPNTAAPYFTRTLCGTRTASRNVANPATATTRIFASAVARRSPETAAVSVVLAVAFGCSTTRSARRAGVARAACGLPCCAPECGASAPAPRATWRRA